MTYHLAIDIGASSGRHILGHIKNDKLILEEIHRFENYIIDKDNTLIWDIDHLVREVKNGILKCRELNKIPETISIDTWGVDYVLLDENNNEILPAVSYRDKRTSQIPEQISKYITSKELYSITGIQKQNFNTIYQLYCDKISGKLDKAKHFLMIPDYLAFKLTGIIRSEYTNATTTSLINVNTKTWDHEILDKLGIRNDIFSDLSMPCTEVGELTEEFGFGSKVILCPSHDTASAVAACPIGDSSAYISSGTWSLLGTENPYPVISEAAMNANFTNEGGIMYRYRFLKNIMGMWLFQNIRRDLGKKYTYDEMMHLAMESNDFKLIDPNDPIFIAPDNMLEAIKIYLNDKAIKTAEILNSVYHSLARSYADTISELERISNKNIDTINIVGGGCQDMYLNQLTKQYTGKTVFAGPVEATATGNIISQLMYSDKKLTLEKARNLVKVSFDIKEV